MFVLTRQMKGSMARGIEKRNPWINQWYLSEATSPNSVSWTGKLSSARLFETRLLASDLRYSNQGPYSMLSRFCTVQMITKKELFEAKLRNR